MVLRLRTTKQWRLWRCVNRGSPGSAVLMEFEAPDYAAEGVNAFVAAISDIEYIARLRIYGAFDGDKLIGVLATRNDNAHIALFFVDGAYHRQGVGRELYYLACNNCAACAMTVNSSPYAVEVYRHLSFRETDAEQTKDGIRFTPMVCMIRNESCSCKRDRCSRHGSCVLCREHHRTKKKTSVSCEREPKHEKRVRERRVRGKG